MIAECIHCGSVWEYYSEDLRMTGNPLTGEAEWYFICPNCQHSVIVGEVYGF